MFFVHIPQFFSVSFPEQLFWSQLRRLNWISHKWHVGLQLKQNKTVSVKTPPKTLNTRRFKRETRLLARQTLEGGDSFTIVNFSVHMQRVKFLSIFFHLETLEIWHDEFWDHLGDTYEVVVSFELDTGRLRRERVWKTCEPMHGASHTGDSKEMFFNSMPLLVVDLLKIDVALPLGVVSD